MRTLISAGFLLLLASSSAQNANNTNANWGAGTLGGGLQMGFPTGDFKDRFGETIYGLSANVALPLRRLPLQIGYDFGWGRMGAESELPSNSGGIFGTPTGPKVEVRSSVYDHLGLVRLNPSQGRYRPYGDLLVGMRHFVTRSTLTTPSQDTEEEKTTNVVSSYGWAVGVMVGITGNLYAEARVERLYTGRVEYVDVGSIEIANDGTVTYEKLTSNVDVINVQLGVGFRF
ncbi:MAG: outer membrane beta-barrel protein [Flavobacteriales bacterium]|nr:outer membrane beta-barrel protein [Flavobacteriales bacterium]